MIKVGLCGYGGLGHLHANNLAQMEDVKICAVCDKRPEQLEARELKTNLDADPNTFDVRSASAYTDYGRMLADEDLDAVVSALPTDLHAEFAVKALAAGCHVFSEKPMALTSEQAGEMIAARNQAGKELMIGQCLRFWPEYNALREMTRDRRYGKLRSLCMERIGGYSDWSEGDWMNQPERAGAAILDLHLHDVDWAYWVFGIPASVYAAARTGRNGGLDDITAVWDYSDGPLVSFRCSWLYRGFTMNARAFFDEAVVEFGFKPDPGIKALKLDSKETETIEAPGPSGHAIELRYFMDCVKGKHKNEVCTAESTRDSVRMIEIEKRSIAAANVINTNGKLD